MSTSSVETPGPIDHDLAWAISSIQACLGLIVGGISFVGVIVFDPFGVATVPIVDGEITQIHWGILRYLEIGLTCLTPFFVSGLCGVFVHPARPASFRVALVKMACVAVAMVLVVWVGSQIFEWTLSTGGSSDLLPGLATLALAALCLTTAAPISSWLIRRRPAKSLQMPADTD